jgi:hypothetical protein
VNIIALELNAELVPKFLEGAYRDRPFGSIAAYRSNETPPDGDQGAGLS